jgi:hypothetical protein
VLRETRPCRRKRVRVAGNAARSPGNTSIPQASQIGFGKLKTCLCVRVTWTEHVIAFPVGPRTLIDYSVVLIDYCFLMDVSKNESAKLDHYVGLQELKYHGTLITMMR